MIPDWLGANVQAAMDAVGVEDAFSFLKQRPEERMRIERRLKRKLQAALKEFEASTAAAIARGEEPDYDALFEALRAAIGPDIAAITTDEAMRLAADVGIVFDPAVINTDAVRWARDYSYELVRGITDTTRTLVGEATATFVETPGMTIGDLTRMLDPAFGPVRAEMIAITETTRAYSQATSVAQEQLNQTGLPMRRIWGTANDDIVCEICGPLNGLPEGEWSGMFGSGPPAHPNCRCFLSLTAQDDEVVIPDAIERAQERVAMLRELGKEKEAAVAEARIEELRGRLYGAGPVSREARPLSLTEQRTQADIDEIKPLVDELIAAGDPTGGGMKGYLDSLQETMREERDINEALWNTMQKTPGQATDAEWTVTADRLQAEGYELYRKYTKEGIAIEVAEQRGAQVSGYMVVGKEQVLVRQGAFSVRTATKMQGELWAEAKTEMTNAIGEMLQRAGFEATDIAQANYEQRIRLLEELGQKELLTTRSGRPSRIDAVPEDARARVVDLVDFDLAAQCANSAIDPLALPTLDAYGKMELADRIRNTRLSGGEQGYVSELNF